MPPLIIPDHFNLLLLLKQLTRHEQCSSYLYPIAPTVRYPEIIIPHNLPSMATAEWAATLYQRAPPTGFHLGKSVGEGKKEVIAEF